MKNLPLIDCLFGSLNLVYDFFVIIRVQIP